jgi:carbonic anhydrase
MMNIDEVMNRLNEGNTRFKEDGLENVLVDQPRRDSLVPGQEPYAIILSCADSRVVPEHAFDSGLGEVFTVRVAGNVANTDSIASIEYAVAHLGSKVIVVLGHQSCGAVTAAMAGGDNGYNLNHLLAHVAPAIAACDAGADVNTVVKKNARLTANDLISRSSIIASAVNEGRVKVAPAYYHLTTGQVEWL